MRIFASGIFRYTIFFLWLGMLSVTASGVWDGDPPLVNKYGEHEFMAACREGNEKAVYFYLYDAGEDEKVDPNQRFKNGKKEKFMERIFLTVTHARRAINKFLSGRRVAENGDSGDVPPLFVAARNGLHGIVKMLLEAGAKPDQIWDGTTPLLVAARNGHHKVVQILISAGAELDQTWYGATSLLMAAHNGQLKVVQILVDAGADLDLAWEGTTPLFRAAQNGHSEVVRILLGKNADPAIECHYGLLFSKSPLTAARLCRPFNVMGFCRDLEKWQSYTDIIQQLTEREKALKKSEGVTAAFVRLRRSMLAWKEYNSRAVTRELPGEGTPLLPVAYAQDK